MRLRKTKELLLEVLDDLDYSSSVRTSNPKTYNLNFVLNLRYAIETLDELNLFTEYVEKLKPLSFFNSNVSSIVIQENEHQVLNKEIPTLHILCGALIESIGKSIPKTESNIISVKIPTPQDFKNLKETADKLDKIFSQTLLHKDIKGSIQISNFDTGSYWIDFIAGGKETIGVVAGLAWSAVVVYKKLQQGKLVQEQVKAMKISNTAFKEIIEKSKEQVNQIAENEAQYIQNKFYKSNEPEQKARIKMSLKELAELYAQGARIYPSIKAAEDVTESFPDFEKLEDITSKIKKLTGKK